MAKRQTKADDEDVDQYLDKLRPKQTNDQVAAFFGVGFFLSALPVFLFVNVYDVTLKEFGVVYLSVTLLSSFLLTLAYRNVATTTVVNLSQKSKDSKNKVSAKGVSREESEALQAAVTKREAIAWSLFFINTAFLALFFFLAFYALKNVPFNYQYALSTAVSSGAVWQLSTIY